MHLKGAKKKNCNKRYYADNKQKISEWKKEVYRKNIETSRLETAAHKKDDCNYDLKEKLFEKCNAYEEKVQQ